MAKFIDEIKITLQAGKGGDGMISFRREAHVDRGGPDGGNGGNGGNIYFVGDLGKNTLLSLYRSKHITAFDGVKGGSKNLYGANGKDMYVKVPIGTLVYKQKKLIADIIKPDVPFLVAKGGKGGRGNAKFKTSKNTAPRICENGLLGEKYEATISLKILSDVGIVGKPSAGKSTLLNVLSNAKAKVATYEFTTLVPQLGMVKYFDNSFTIADLPGLIKGASLGKGLGIQFLKHIERCKIIAHLIDFGEESKNPINDYLEINKELENYKFNLHQKKQVVIANKKDLQSFSKNLKMFKEKFPGVVVVEISAILKENLDDVKKVLWEMIQKTLFIPTEENNEEVVITYEPDFYVKSPFKGFFEVTGKKIEELYQRIPISSYDNLLRFNNILKKIGVWDELIRQKISPGDTVQIYSYQFEWEDL